MKNARLIFNGIEPKNPWFHGKKNRDFFAEFDGKYHRDLNGIFIQQIV